MAALRKISGSTEVETDTDTATASTVVSDSRPAAISAVSAASRVAQLTASWIASGPRRALLGSRAALVRRPTWSLRFWAAVNALKAGAWAVPRNVHMVRMVTDHAIPRMALPHGVELRTAVELVPAGAGGTAAVLGEVYTPIVRGEAAECGAGLAASSSSAAAAVAVGLPRPAVLYAHGGAYCCCSSATHRRLLSELAKASGATIFAVDYRRPRVLTQSLAPIPLWPKLNP